MRFNAILLFLVLVTSCIFAYITCPSTCECLSSYEFKDKYGRDYNYSDFCDFSKYFSPCGDDLVHDAPRFCYKIITPPTPEPECGDHKCEGSEDAETCPEDCLGTLEAYRGADDPGSHEWSYDESSTDIWNEMLLLKLDAGDQESVRIINLTLKAGGTGYDDEDIESIDVYYDENDNGRVDESDVLVGYVVPAYGSDEGTTTIFLEMVVSKDQIKPIIIAYIMSSDAPVGKTYYFTVNEIKALGVNSNFNITTTGLPLTSGTKTVSKKKVQCTGPVGLTLNPNPALSGENVNAAIFGLNGCDGKTANVYSMPCATAAANELQCFCVVAGPGCGCAFNAPALVGVYPYYGCVDLDQDNTIDGDEEDVDDLEVQEKVVPLPPPEPECKNNDKCADNARCIEEKCENVTGTCGAAANHIWNKYECGDEASCMPCQTNTTCHKNKCLKVELNIPNNTNVGEPVNITVLIGSEPFGNTQITITDPTGKSITLVTDKSGKAVFTPTYEGKYGVVAAGASKVVTAKAKGLFLLDMVSSFIAYIVEDPVKPCGLTVVGIIVLVGLLWYFRKKQARPVEFKPPGEKEE